MKRILIFFILLLSSCQEPPHCGDLPAEKRSECCKENNIQRKNCVGEWIYTNQTCNYKCRNKDQIIYDAENNTYSVSYEKGILYYTIILEKPSACHSIEIKEHIISNASQVTIQIIYEKQGGICLKMKKSQTIQGNISIDNPQYVSIYQENDLLYTQKIIS